jgi:large subunit ribosomal protein L25
MQVTKITAASRTENGKGACRRLRAAGKLPAVTYKKGSEARALTVSPVEVADVLNSSHGVNSLVELEIDGKSIKAMISEYQYHPLSRKLLHADFLEVQDGQKVEVNVPLRLTGKARGIVLGGKLRTVYRELPLRCLVTAIPAEVVHDITELDVEGSLSVGELVLPEGVEVLLGDKRTLAVVAVDRRAKGEETADGEGAKDGAAASDGK